MPGQGDIETVYSNIMKVLNRGRLVVLRPFFTDKPELKSPREIGLMREAGKLVAEALRLCRAMAKPGVQHHRDRPGRRGLFHVTAPCRCSRAIPARRCRSPPSTCISLNEQVVHGIPGQRQIREGDLVKIDTACKLNGWCADAAITLLVGEVRGRRRRLVEVAEQVLRIAMVEMARRRWWSEVAGSMQRHAENGRLQRGDAVRRPRHRPHHAREPAGAQLRQPRDAQKHDFRLEEGLVLAVEPMVNMGRADTDVLRDHWTVVTRDGLPSAHVEHTLALTREGVKIITADTDDLKSVLLDERPAPG